jgi:hypothetical protein
VTVIRRLDHIIVAVHDRREWIPRIETVLGLRPGRMLEDAGEGDGAFNNAEFAIGDGFLGIVEPPGPQSQLHRFLARFGDGFYAMSIDVGDVDAAIDAFDRAGVSHLGSPPGLVWIRPQSAHGVAYQVIDGMLLGPGANPRYLGVRAMTVVVDDLERAVDDYRNLFGFGDATELDDDVLGYLGAVLSIDGSTLDDVIVLAEPSTDDTAAGRQLAARGEGIFSFGIAVADLDGEVERLTGLGIATLVEDGPWGRRAPISPGALGSLRVDLLDHGPSVQSADARLSGGTP